MIVDARVVTLENIDRALKTFGMSARRPVILPATAESTCASIAQPSISADTTKITCSVP